ncbi:hypothetical protein K438DRAFT_1929751 [Mycena galopus ATCC 62051]|nr:hypothetical protein K438DRAFT_1929751 [Mycena galopus ATCC 62051]
MNYFCYWRSSCAASVPICIVSWAARSRQKGRRVTAVKRDETRGREWRGRNEEKPLATPAQELKLQIRKGLLSPPRVVAMALHARGMRVASRAPSPRPNEKSPLNGKEKEGRNRVRPSKGTETNPDVAFALRSSQSHMEWVLALGNPRLSALLSTEKKEDGERRHRCGPHPDSGTEQKPRREKEKVDKRFGRGVVPQARRETHSTLSVSAERQ